MTTRRKKGPRLGKGAASELTESTARTLDKRTWFVNTEVQP
jgi:hypothetical protein